MELTLQHATIADAPVLAAMNRQLADDERSRNPMTVDALTTRMEKWLGEGWQAVLFLNGSQTIVGYALFQIGHDYYDASIPEIYVRQFFIARDRRRHGIGRRAWAMLSKEVFPSGSHIHLDVLATNPGGRHFWASLGFQPYSMALRLAPSEVVELRT